MTNIHQLYHALLLQGISRRNLTIYDQDKNYQYLYYKNKLLPIKSIIIYISGNITILQDDDRANFIDISKPLLEILNLIQSTIDRLNERK